MSPGQLSWFLVAQVIAHSSPSREHRFSHEETNVTTLPFSLDLLVSFGVQVAPGRERQPVPW